MRIGTSKVQITPPVGSPMAGYSNRTSFATGVHDDLFARTLLIDVGGRRAAITACDLIGILPEMTAEARNEAAALGVPDSSYIVCAYHNHSGPTPDFGYASMDQYMAQLSSGLASSVREAASRMVEVGFSSASRNLDGLAINRRRPSGGTVDPELLVLCWQAAAGSGQAAAEPVAHLLNFSCHAVVLGPDNTLISADYPGYAMAQIEGKTGSTCLFTNGACGDINPLTSSLRARMESGEDVYDRTGGQFGEASALGHKIAAAALEFPDAARSSSVALATSTHSLEIGTHPPASEAEISARITKLQETLQAMIARGERADVLYRAGLELAFCRRTLAAVRKGTIAINLMGIRIGEVVLLGIPGEVFVEIGLSIKKKARSLGLTLAVVELANDYLSYMPTQEAFSEGGYEVEIARSLGFGPELERELVEVAGSLLERLAAD